MFFTIAKFLDFLLTPSNIVFIAIILGLALSLLGWRRIGRGIALLGLCLGCAAIWTPLPFWLLIQLETRFPQPTPDTSVDGIVVLGGGIDVRLDQTSTGPIYTSAGSRIIAAAELAHQYPQARVLLSGGNPKLIGTLGTTEAQATKNVLVRMGVSPDRILTETISRDTYENAVESRKVAQPKDGEHWLLVTSAAHMPRAVGVFTSALFPVIPYPVDYKTQGWRDMTRIPGSAAQGLLYLDLAGHEWVGLAVYRLSGRVPALLPAP